MRHRLPRRPPRHPNSQQRHSPQTGTAATVTIKAKRPATKPAPKRKLSADELQPYGLISLIPHAVISLPAILLQQQRLLSNPVAITLFLTALALQITLLNWLLPEPEPPSRSPSYYQR